MTARSADQGRCQELRDARQTATAPLAPAGRDTANPAFHTVPGTTDAGDTTPDARFELEHQIRELERALREAGCE
ncbi:MAG: hypothetical protein GEU80_01150 [Dehalococcoidia bacterium]|nr:hypothetical protein [Dehalococcoidia bacterium]